MAGYIGSIPVPQATQTREAFTATSNQTTFNTGGYTAGFIDVYMNGVKLAAADFTATNGSDVVLASGAAANDIVEVVAYTAFEVLNQNFTGTTTVEALTATGAISGTSADFDGGVTIDNITIDGAEIDLSAGDLLLDVAGDIILDSDGGTIKFKDGGTHIANIGNSSSDLVIENKVQDKDIKFLGDDGGAGVTALTLDMSAAGAATFNSSVTLANTLSISSASTSAFLQASSNILQFGTSSDDPVAFFANNAERMRLTADGRLGLGTNSPAYTLTAEKDVDTWVSRLYNTGSDADAAGLLVRTDATAAHNALALGVYADSAYKMVVRSNGNVGIGTTDPQFDIHVHQGDSTNSLIQFTNTTTGSTASDGLLVGLDSSEQAQVWMRENSILRFATNDTERVRIGSSGEMQLGGTTNAGFIDFDSSSLQLNTQRNPNTGAFVNTGRAHASIVLSDGNGTASNSYIRFMTASSNNTVASERMRINSSGNVHITDNSNGPDAALHIEKTTPQIRLQLNGNSGYNTIESGGSNELIIGRSGSEQMRIDSSGHLMLGTTTEGNAAADNLTLSGSGHVGITIRSTDSSSSRIYFSDATSGTGEYVGYMIYDHPVNAMIFGTSSTEHMRIDSSGNVGFSTTNTSIATSNSEYGLMISGGGRIFSTINNDHHDLNRASGNGELIRCRRGGTQVGSISVTLSATAFNTSSDYRLKTDAKPITGATDRIKQLNPVNFKWIVDDTRADGFIAHEAEAVVPEAITGAKDAVDADGNPVYQGIDQSKLVPLLVATIKELEARITTLESN